MIATATTVFRPLLRLGLIPQIVIGIVAGVLLALLVPDIASDVALLGQLFIAALQAVAPILVFVLVAAAIAAHQAGQPTHIRSVLLLYVAGTLIAALIAVAASFALPTELALDTGQVDGNFIAILAWAIGLGLTLRQASDTTRQALSDLSAAITRIVTLVIRLAPLGIFGLVAGTLAESGVQALLNYAQLLGVIVGCMLFVALVSNPLLVYLATRQNPYPLVFTCLRGSAITAFFTRSSAANIPVNLELCRRLDLDADTYAISIPLGATINMCGAAITITVITLATTHTLGISVDFPSALLLCIVSALAACGVSGVAGGSLMLIPMAASLFGIPTEVAMQAVAIGFVISVVQDSTETALNSSTDVLFTAAACRARKPD